MKYLLLLVMLFVTVSHAGAEGQTDKEAHYEGIAITVNVNTAPADELAALLKGVGLKKAQRIVEHREKNGPFKNPDDLVNVKGIGIKLVNANRERLNF